jgi:hypothetical protein
VPCDHDAHAGEDQESGTRHDGTRRQLMIQDKQHEGDDPQRDHDHAGHPGRP